MLLLPAAFAPKTKRPCGAAVVPLVVAAAAAVVAVVGFGCCRDESAGALNAGIGAAADALLALKVKLGPFCALLALAADDTAGAVLPVLLSGPWSCFALLPKAADGFAAVAAVDPCDADGDDVAVVGAGFVVGAVVEVGNLKAPNFGLSCCCCCCCCGVPFSLVAFLPAPNLNETPDGEPLAAVNGFGFAVAASSFSFCSFFSFFSLCSFFSPCSFFSFFFTLSGALLVAGFVADPNLLLPAVAAKGFDDEGVSATFADAANLNTGLLAMLGLGSLLTTFGAARENAPAFDADVTAVAPVLVLLEADGGAEATVDALLVAPAPNEGFLPAP